MVTESVQIFTTLAKGLSSDVLIGERKLQHPTIILTLIPTGVGADLARTFSYHQTASTMKELAS